MKRVSVLLAAIVLCSVLAAGQTLTRNLHAASSTVAVDVSAGWNLLAVPVIPADSSKGAIFSAASSSAFAFQAGYVAHDTLTPGVGYWLKFSSAQTLMIGGDSLFDLAVPVTAGWNMIGALSLPLPASLLYSEPESLLASKCFRFVPGAGYQEADTLWPGMGYWVKTHQSGVVYLTAPAAAPPAFSDAQRSVVLDSVSAHVNTLTGSDPVADNLTLLAYLRTVPEFEASDTARGGVWARFTDGRLFMYSNNFDVTDTSGGEVFGEVSGSSFPVTKAEQPRTVSDNLPFSTSIWITNALGPWFSTLPGGGAAAVANQIRDWHGMAGYLPSANDGATVAELKGVSNVGVFYISTHGAFALDRSGTYVYGLYTASPRSEFFDQAYQRDLDDRTLIYYSAPHGINGLGQQVSETHYAVTSIFVRKYMGFQKKSAVFLNSCSSYNDSMIVAFEAKGAKLFAGWTKPVSGRKALRAARRFFDRMLGTNMYEPETPPQRPFDADLAWEDLIQHQLDVSTGPSGVSKFYLHPFQPETNLLAPSILQVYPAFIPGETDFTIDGLFGDDPGAAGAVVTVGGTPLTRRQWVNSTKLTFDPPTHGGDVVVKVRGIKSNATQYSKWHAVFDYTVLSRGSLKKHIVFNVDFLADMHRFRINIGQAPIFGPGPRYIQVLNTSTATFECSGEYKNPKDTAIVEEYWTGSGTVPLSDVSPGFSFSTALKDVGETFPAGLTFDAEYNNTGFPAQLTIEGGLGDLMLVLNSSYAISTGSKSFSEGNDTGEILWGNIVPLYPPDPNGAR